MLRRISASKIQIMCPHYVDNENKVFEYSDIFGEETDNAELFDSTMITPIENALSGFNSTVFVYGMTGAGKTYTMFGSEENTCNGMVFMTLNRLLGIVAG